VVSPGSPVNDPSVGRGDPEPRLRPRPPRRLRRRRGAVVDPASGPPVVLEPSSGPPCVGSLAEATTEPVCVSSVIRAAPFFVPGAALLVAEVRDLAVRERVPSATPSGAPSVSSCSSRGGAADRSSPGPCGASSRTRKPCSWAAIRPRHSGDDPQGRRGRGHATRTSPDCPEPHGAASGGQTCSKDNSEAPLPCGATSRTARGRAEGGASAGARVCLALAPWA
jgi:hypothetical protein